MTSSALLEAVLFAHGAPMERDVVGELLSMDDAMLEETIQTLRTDLAGRGIQLQTHRDHLELVSCVEAAPLIQRFRADEARTELSKPALETLAVFLYRGALTRPELEEIRGIYSHQILRSLLQKGLIAETGEERVAQTVYDVTPLCLQWLGLADRRDLPPLA